jgi:hypothetical protein
VWIKLWIKLGKNSNNQEFVVETAVDKPLVSSPNFSYLLGSGCGEKLEAKV